MLDTTIIATVPTTTKRGWRAKRDLLDGLEGLPADDAIDHLRAAQDAIHHGAWELPRVDAEPLMLAIGRTVGAA